jgi:hypothetical protein
MRAARKPKRTVKLFVSYAHKNKVWMDDLTPVLRGFKHDERLMRLSTRVEYYVHAWTDSELPMGIQWDQEIRRELELMDIFVPLVSHHFFESRYIQTVELARAKERHADPKDAVSVVPIKLYPITLEQKSSFLHGFPCLPAWDRCWSHFADRNEAHCLIDDGLWNAIEQAMSPKSRRS